MYGHWLVRYTLIFCMHGRSLAGTCLCIIRCSCACCLWHVFCSRVRTLHTHRHYKHTTQRHRHPRADHNQGGNKRRIFSLPGPIFIPTVSHTKTHMNENNTCMHLLSRTHANTHTHTRRQRRARDARYWLLTRSALNAPTPCPHSCLFHLRDFLLADPLCRPHVHLCQCVFLILFNFSTPLP